jgi:hypothetical protein
VKKEWMIEISQNGWEYMGHACIKAKKCEKISEKIIIADGVEIIFDEEINNPYVIKK